MPIADSPQAVLEATYAKAAREYLHSLPLEHFMEATAQARQRKTTLESLDLVHARCPEVQVFNELLVQYPVPGRRRPGQVVPDNLVVLYKEPIKADLSYDVPLQPVGPFWALDYVSKHNRRKDYEESFRKYERDLKVPYYLVFYPEKQELTLYHHRAQKYRQVRRNAQGRYPIPELDLEVALHEGWVRFWYQGQLLPLPADLQRELDETRQQLAQQTDRAEEATQRAAELQRQLEQQQQRNQALEREPELLRAQASQPAPPPGDASEQS